MGLLDKILGRREVPPEEARNLGRNQPCWCGSGKKYKKCHYQADSRYFSQRLAAACKPAG
jgi:uncharacterized protein YecA (UPF0149 family)